MHDVIYWRPLVVLKIDFLEININEDTKTQPSLKEATSKKKSSGVKKKETSSLPVKQEIVEPGPEVIQQLPYHHNGIKMTRSGRVSKPKRRDDEEVKN